jgi:hypothetical protein
MIEALKASFGIVSRAAKKAEITREIHYHWLKHDPDYAERCVFAVYLAKEERLDVLEQLGMKRCIEGSDSMIQFNLRMLGKERGYIDRTETKVTTSYEAMSEVEIEAKLAELRGETGDV